MVLNEVIGELLAENTSVIVSLDGSPSIHDFESDVLVRCGIVELRSDLILGSGGIDLLDQLSNRYSVLPQIATHRIVSEGGNHPDHEPRKIIFDYFLDNPQVGAVDIEGRARDAQHLHEAARTAGKAAIFSFHYTQEPVTPEQFEADITLGLEQQADAVKIASVANDPDSLIALAACAKIALEMDEFTGVPLLVMPMGKFGDQRLATKLFMHHAVYTGFPGSRTAPGQPNFYFASNVIDEIVPPPKIHPNDLFE